jgi:thioredoxin 1
MNQWIRRNIDKLVVVVAVVVLVGMAFGARLTEFRTAGPLTGQLDTDTQSTGDSAMLTATKPQGKVQHATESNFGELVLNSDVPVLVDFYADWCGPCRMIALVLEELARESTNARIVKVNVDHSPQLAARYGIESIPSLKVFENGEVVDEQVGLVSKAQLKTMLGI